MRLAPYLCLSGFELADVARVTSYGECEFFDGACPCPALDSEIYVSPELDPAPWYNALYPESADFLGLLPSSITLSAPATRPVSPAAAEGSFVGPQRLAGRVVEVTGWMVARTTEAMWWGQRWLSEALSRRCEGCADDTLQVLPFCRDEVGYDYAQDFRTLVNVASVDGPRWKELSDDPSYLIVETQFQLTSSMPWLYLPPVRCLEDEPVGGGSDPATTCSLTTPQWRDGTFVIDITATTAVTDILITGKVSLDGDCPVSDPGTSVMDCFTYLVEEMAADDRLVIDGTRRQAYFYDASEKFATPLLPRLDFEGPFRWPDVQDCTTVCLSIEAGTGDATATVDTYLREL